jgi:hypothetical protein
VALNPVTNKIYVANGLSNNVTLSGSFLPSLWSSINHRVEKSLHLCLVGLRIRRFDPIAEASELPDQVQDQPDLPTLSVGNRSNGLIMS